MRYALTFLHPVDEPPSISRVHPALVELRTDERRMLAPRSSAVERMSRFLRPVPARGHAHHRYWPAACCRPALLGCVARIGAESERTPKLACGLREERNRNSSKAHANFGVQVWVRRAACPLGRECISWQMTVPAGRRYPHKYRPYTFSLCGSDVTYISYILLPHAPAA